jgi:glycine cleavage system aminomethyltransferase T
VTTGIWSPRFACNVGFAMMERGYETPGTKIEVACADGVTRRGEVCLLPMEGS